MTTALCLSGGGYRAALFHLGALRRLYEVGVLARVEAISSVSGGSIIAAHLAGHIGALPLETPDVSAWEQHIAVPFRTLTTHNLRTWPFLRRMLPWNWLRESTAVEGLEAGYTRYLTRQMLADLPPHPRFIFCATDLTFGVNWTFERERFGDYEAGYSPEVATYPVARAVAASSCFPPVFDPLDVPVDGVQLARGQATRRPDWATLRRSLRLVDGGVYDNLGLEPVWKKYDVVLVSDGGSPFNAAPDSNFLLRLNRYVAVIGKQSAALRKRWLIASFSSKRKQGAYWGISGTTAGYGQPDGYSKDLATAISRIRTDLDAFSEGEIAVLENHGYLLADAALQRHGAALLPPTPRPLRVPHPAWMDETRAAQAIAGSRAFNLLGRWRVRRRVAGIQ